MIIRRRDLPQMPQSLRHHHPVLQRVYAARGIQEESQLLDGLQSLLPFERLMDIEKAVARLVQALEAREAILVIGDFDADGATSTTLAVAALRVLGAKSVDFLVPNRFEYGYGLTPDIVAVASQKHPKLIITVDNGTSSIEGVNFANQLGIDVLVTDHHLPGETLPEACAIVNPNQNGDGFSSKSIAGVGVIFYVLLALRRKLVELAWFDKIGIPAPNMAQFLDLVALGTVADVVFLDQNNRILIKQGLARIQQGLCRVGLKALIEVSGKSCGLLRESDLGFSIAPRLNAAGRLDDMSLGINCLLSQDFDEAQILAQKLNQLNLERRKIETEMKEQALAALNQLSLSAQSGALPIALCLLDESWHQGVIGILAGRLKERYHRPVVAFAKVSEEEIKGSVRSVANLNIRDVLAAVDRAHPGLISKFGGHAMAAGLSLPLASFPLFKESFLNEVGKYLSLQQCLGECLTDGALSPNELSLDLALLIQSGGPWGQGFPEPIFDDVFEILDQRMVGQQHLKLSLVHEEGGEILEAIAFNVDIKLWPNHRARYLRAAYRLDVNQYRGKQRLQLILETFELASKAFEERFEHHSLALPS